MHHSIEPGDAYDSDIMDASGNEIATESLTLVCEFVSVIAFEL